MKNLRHFTVFAIAMATLFTSCTTDDVNNSPEGQEVQGTVQVGNWRITNFNDSGEDETSDFAGYNFTFAQDGILTATNGTNTLTGTWSVDNDDDDVDFIIFFPVSDTSDFEDLNEDWDIVSISDTKLDLIDRDDDDDDDRLVFERN